MKYWLGRAKTELERGARDIQAFMGKVDGAWKKSEITDAEYSELKAAFQEVIDSISKFLKAFDKIITEPFEKK